MQLPAATRLLDSSDELAPGVLGVPLRSRGTSHRIERESHASEGESVAC